MNTLKLTREREGAFGVNDEGRTTMKIYQHYIDEQVPCFVRWFCKMVLKKRSEEEI